MFFRATYVDATHDDGYYYFDGGMTTQVGGSVQSYDLKWFGGAKISWTIYDGPTQRTCAQAGIETVYVNFKDSSGNLRLPGLRRPAALQRDLGVLQRAHPGTRTRCT